MAAPLADFLSKSAVFPLDRPALWQADSAPKLLTCATCNAVFVLFPMQDHPTIREGGFVRHPPSNGVAPPPIVTTPAAAGAGSRANVAAPLAAGAAAGAATGAAVGLAARQVPQRVTRNPQGLPTLCGSFCSLIYVLTCFLHVYPSLRTVSSVHC